MSPEPLEFPLERDYVYYDQIQRERGLPYAYKLVVDEAIKLRLFAADSPPSPAGP